MHRFVTCLAVATLGLAACSGNTSMAPEEPAPATAEAAEEAEPEVEPELPPETRVEAAERREVEAAAEAEARGEPQGVPVGRELAADVTEDAFADESFATAFAGIAEGFGPPDVERVVDLEYDRTTNTIRLLLATGLTDPGDVRNVAWMITDLYVLGLLGDTNFLVDLRPTFELSLGDDTWSCSGDDVELIASGDMIERHWNEACG
jgi:hypothetical protein